MLNTAHVLLNKPIQHTHFHHNMNDKDRAIIPMYDHYCTTLCPYRTSVKLFTRKILANFLSTNEALSFRKRLERRPDALFIHPTFTDYTPYITPIPNHNMVCMTNIAPPYLGTTTIAQRSVSIVQMLSDFSINRSFTGKGSVLTQYQARLDYKYI